VENSDAVIIQKCLDGNTEAFSELVTRYKKLIYGITYRLAEDPQEAGDLSQEAFLKIFKSLNQYKVEYKFSTWAVKITTNLCLDWKRRKKGRTVPLEEVQGVISSFHTPESEYLKKELKQTVRDALDELPEKYRIPLILFHQAGLSYEELTEILKEPMSIIKNRLYRARLMLKDKLTSERKEGAL
jgi:RNA polymerase sigma factor (sigma-70 family)